MNHIRQRNYLEVQLKNFKDFIPFCPNDSLPALLHEMSKIHDRLEKLREYTIEQLVKEVHFHYETRQSKSNFRTI
ncbi:hypothetical protein [Flavobacterium anhuiense]|uniref:hypothetical protein n=1 Tax=Flavobacterium anhuiense TaxID=459526 RepID=UPI00202655FF|nr:hypothetical protein [Flavobacterium anhuiense]URM37179.1 hypothetical protein LLY39_00880 [Flavobacterium anhuiense]